MKRFCLIWAVFLVLLGLIYSCSINVLDETAEYDPDSDFIYDYEDETEEYPPEPEPEPTVFLACAVLSEVEVNFEFSSPVTLISLSFDPILEIASVEEGSTVKVLLDEIPRPGLRHAAEILAEDEWGNLISVLVSFASRNNRVPELQINELRTEYSRPRAEFIEFKMITEGNLGALRVFAASNNRTPMIYEFPSVEVKAGEYVALHLRTLEDPCMDELGGNLDESGGTDSCPAARDLWIPGSNKLLHKTDAVYVLDQDDRVLSAVIIAEAPAPSWDRDYFIEAAGFLFSKGAWESPTGGPCTPMDAVSSSNIGSALTRSISRDETVNNTNTAADWYVTANGGVSPGLPNNPKRF